MMSMLIAIFIFYHHAFFLHTVIRLQEGKRFIKKQASSICIKILKKSWKNFVSHVKV